MRKCAERTRKVKPINAFNSDEKILRHHDKINAFMQGHKTLVVAEIDLTNICNNDCPHCCGIRTNDAMLSTAQIDWIADGLRSMEARGVILSGGGEPLMSPNFAYALKRIRESGCRIGLNSNGLSLDENACALIAEHCDYFRVSLDAATPGLYRKTHGLPKAAFEKVIKNCRMFAGARNQLRSGAAFGIGFLTHEQATGEMEEFVILAQDIGADFAQFRPLTGGKEPVYDVREKILELQAIYTTKYFKVAASMQKYERMEDAGRRNYEYCMGMFFSTVITADAKVFACIHYRQDARYYLGEITHSNSLVDIFRSARMRSVYESIDCKKCPVLCRNDAFNRMLYAVSQDMTNQEFL